MSKSTSPATIDEIWTLVKETQKNLKEVSVNQKETEKNLKEFSIGQKELQDSQKETDRSIKELSVSQKETDRQMQETDRQIQKIGGRFNQRWGAFVESLVSGNLVKILQNWGIDIMQTHTHSEAQWKKANGSIQKREFDIIAANGTEVVAVEVKTTLSSKDVRKFLETLKDFKKYFPRYKTETIYGAIAYLKSEDIAHIFAEESGLFVIRATGDSASIINKKDFKPKSF